MNYGQQNCRLGSAAVAARGLLEGRDVRAQPGEGLPELAPAAPATENDQVFRQDLEVRPVSLVRSPDSARPGIGGTVGAAPVARGA